MGFSGESSGGGEGWGMGLLLVFFSEENFINVGNKKKSGNTRSTSLLSPSSSSPSATCGSILRSTDSSLLLAKAQSTISICALLVFITLLVFTLCTFEPAFPAPNPHIQNPSRRFLTEKPLRINRFNPHSPLISSFFGFKSPSPHFSKPFALQKMGVLFRRGTRAMNDLAICHISENVTVDELRLFLRLLHRSGLTSRSDIVLIFSASPSAFKSVIEEENESFLKLVRRFSESSSNATTAPKLSMSFDSTQFMKVGNKSEKEKKEPLWGKKNRDREEEGGDELTRLNYGSVVGFEAVELDPENTLDGFMDHVPLSLRRWACYQMLLGRVRRNFKHVMFVDVKNSVVVRDPLGRVRNKKPESVYLYTAKHGSRKSSEQKLPPLSPAVVMGGARGMRRFASAVLVEIVRSATQHKGKNPVSESTLLSQLAQNDFVLKSVALETSKESIPEASSLVKLSTRTASFRHGVVLRGSKNHDFDSVIMREICSYELESYVYENCLV